MFFNYVSVFDEGFLAGEQGAEGGVIGDLMFYVVPYRDGYAVKCAHSAAYSDATAERFMEVFERLLAGMVAGDDLAGIRYVTDADAALQDAVSGPVTPLRYGNAVEAFLRRAEDTPDLLYAVYLDHRVTYGE